nr:MAG TPA_asm: hypothetical protein [Caudoviricetes sp.]
MIRNTICSSFYIICVFVIQNSLLISEVSSRFLCIKLISKYILIVE